MCKAMGLDPNSIEQIPFSAVNKTYVYRSVGCSWGEGWEQRDRLAHSWPTFFDFLTHPFFSSLPHLHSAPRLSSLEDIVLASVPFDFWWIDWQQGGTQGGCAGEKQNPTIWTDKIRVTGTPGCRLHMPNACHVRRSAFNAVPLPF